MRLVDDRGAALEHQLIAADCPLEVAVPKFSSVSPLRVTEPSLAYARDVQLPVLLAMKVPVPLIEPEPEFAFVQVAVPLTVIVS